jgi:uroporphyrinogen-III synthase
MLGMTLAHTVLISRPEADSNLLASSLRRLEPSIDCLIAPAIEIAPLDIETVHQKIDLVNLTSRHAAAAAAKFYPNVKTICVGRSTAQRAEELGLHAISTDGTSEEILSLIKTMRVGRVLHLRGQHSRGNIAERLADFGIQAFQQISYEQHAQPFTPQVTHKLQEIPKLLIPIYSPRTSQIIAQNLAEYMGALTMIAISTEAADAWTGSKPDRVIIAQKPNATAMFAAITSHLHRSA